MRDLFNQRHLPRLHLRGSVQAIEVDAAGPIARVPVDLVAPGLLVAGDEGFDALFSSPVVVALLGAPSDTKLAVCALVSMMRVPLLVLRSKTLAAVL